MLFIHFFIQTEATQLPHPSCLPRSGTTDILGNPYTLTGDICHVHDPCGAIDNKNNYYIFSTDQINTPPYLLQRCGGKDGINWTVCGSVFPTTLPIWIKNIIPGITGLWAPDISYFENKWYLYYAASTYGSQVSAIGLVTATILDPSDPNYGFVDEGLVFSTKNGDDFNAIDPAHYVDEDGNRWLTFGSFWKGIYVLPLDKKTGKPLNGSIPIHLAERGADDALEASSPVTIQHGHVWLLSSWNYCCRGVNSTYEVHIGRANTINGTFFDKDNISLLNGGGTLVVGKSKDWVACGGQSVIRNTTWSFNNTKALLVIHAYDSKTGDPWLQTVSLIENPNDVWVQIQSGW